MPDLRRQTRNLFFVERINKRHTATRIPNNSMKNTWTAASIDDLKALLVFPCDSHMVKKKLHWWLSPHKICQQLNKRRVKCTHQQRKMDSYKWMKCQLSFECEWCNAERDANLIIGKMGCEFLNICRNTYGPKWWWKLNWMFAVWNSVTSTDFTKQCGRWVNLTTWYGIQYACSSTFFLLHFVANVTMTATAISIFICRLTSNLILEQVSELASFLYSRYKHLLDLKAFCEPKLLRKHFWI